MGKSSQRFTVHRSPLIVDWQLSTSNYKVQTTNYQRTSVNVHRLTVNLLWPLVYTLLTFLPACNSPYTPKPTGYFKIDFPQKNYQQFNQPGYPYTFEFPTYASVIKDSTFFDSATENPWWINIDFPQFNARVYLSYKVIGKYKLDSLLNDAFNLTNKHSIKATYIDDSVLNVATNVHGEFFQVEGNVATASQFFLTDSTKNFIRGALYFDATPNQDSLSPVNHFLNADIKHLIATFRWK